MTDIYDNIKLDVGCGKDCEPGYLGMDIRNDVIVDIQHDICKFPWPLPDSCCIDIRMSLVWACIEPKYRIKVMNELWRIAKVGCKLAIKEAHSLSRYIIQDPTYYNGANEYTFLYFDSRDEKYEVYKPKPWKVNKYYYNCTTIVYVEMEPLK